VRTIAIGTRARRSQSCTSGVMVMMMVMVVVMVVALLLVLELTLARMARQGAVGMAKQAAAHEASRDG